MRLGEDEQWMWAEIRREYLPPGRPRQLAVVVPDVKLPPANPLRAHDRPTTREPVPEWVRKLSPPRPQDDPVLFPRQVDGQLGLFPPPRRTLVTADAGRIRDRPIPQLDLVDAQLADIARERKVGGAWLNLTRSLARLALAAREPGQRQVLPQTLDDLPSMSPTIAEALRRVGLLADARSRVVPGSGVVHGSCTRCLAWANDRRQVCVACRQFARFHPGSGECERCRSVQPLAEGLCRFCTVLQTQAVTDFDGIALEGGDQLWFGAGFAPKLRTTDARYPPRTRRKGRFVAKKRLVKAAARAARSISDHLIDPAQTALFEAPARDWASLGESDLPAPTPEAEAVMAEFARYIRSRGWNPDHQRSSTRILRILVSWLGVRAPIREIDIQAVALLSSNHTGARVTDFLRRRELLIAEEKTSADLLRARDTAASLPESYAAAVNTWIDVLTGQGSKPSRPIAPTTIYNYVSFAAPILRDFSAQGITDLRQVTKEIIEAALKPLSRPHARSVHTGLRSLFRALRREGLIFRDPARTISLTIARHKPVPLPTDRLKGILDNAPDARSRLVIALVAIHALMPGEITSLHLDDLDRAQGRLRVRRKSRPDHLVYLDEMTLELARSWAAERFRRWPRTPNPHLFINRETAVNGEAPVSRMIIRTSLKGTGLQAGKLRQDRILDEAHEGADPVRLMRVFGISAITAMKYVSTAHPADIRPDPIAP
ncbi:tyrosine-type recombinase/integrase [Streptomyces sp. MB09-01]|uniref:tyrosine-type recombinase/integrase n=1 Tax=Streptomyces sp. MB09-01 TaxID=3028666 RepID=UPI0029A4C7D4|nr:tyrosine-type recombinase/integrase [Streptomyces sp. MB09-01]MDX3534007.1 tyrosine-type recombinase/integrase [Streptomyces sp. MB09-01]